MRSSTVLRIPEALFETVRDEITAWDAHGLETFAFLTLARVAASSRVLYLARSVVLLGDGEVVRRPTRTHPTREFCEHFYGALVATGAFHRGTRLAAVHSHPFNRGGVRLSETDRSSFDADRKVYAMALGTVEFLGVVFDGMASAFDGVVVHPDGAVPLGDVQVVGRTFRRLPLRGEK